MPTIRRLYFYAVAFVSFELVLWGVIGLLRSIFARPLVPSTDALARALALILVGVPIFLIHWRWAQRAADRDPDERSATVRAVFLYGMQLSTLLPVARSTLALLNRSLVELAGIRSASAFVGGSQTLSDNLIAILFNGVAAYYFVVVTRRDWTLLEKRESYADIRRLYRFIWVLYSLALTVWGTQQIIRYIFYIPSGTLGLFGRTIFLNALAMLVVGAPLWVYTWQLSLSALDEPGERESNLRLAFLYLVSLVSALTVLSAGGVLLYNVLLQAFGPGASAGEFAQKVGTSISLLVPFAATWLYYGRANAAAIDEQSDPGRRAALRRLYHYPLSLAGLGAAFVGTTLLLTYIIHSAFATFVTPLVLGSQLAAALSALIVGLPVWLFMWRGVQAEVRAPGDQGGHARRSLVRKVYLFLIIFAAVIGIMSAAVWLVFQVISALLSSAPANFTQDLLIALQLLLLFVAVLAYHLTVLRSDGARTADALTARHAAFPVLVLAPDETFASAVADAIARGTPDMPVTVHPLDLPLAAEATDGTRAAVLPAAMALGAPESIRLWLEGFEGAKVVIPEDVTGWVWSGQSLRPLDKGADQAALALRQLAEGETVRPSASTSPWMIVLYILAGLFTLEVLGFLLALLASFITD